MEVAQTPWKFNRNHVWIGLVVLMLVVLVPNWFAGKNNGRAVSCVGVDRGGGLNGTDRVLNTCKMPVNAMVCSKWVLSGSYTCGRSRIYQPGDLFSLLPGDRTSWLGKVALPHHVRVLACHAGYAPKGDGQSREFSCHATGKRGNS